MRNVFKRLRLGFLTVSCAGLIIFGAAGYATFSEAEQQCAQIAENGEFISGTFIALDKKD